MSSSVGWIAGLAVAVLFVAALSLVARKRRGARTTPTSLYIDALDALLAGEEGRALELLRETVRMDSGNVAAYIRLGTLFRHKGETGRATRIHREVAIRPRIGAQHREAALRELVLDYTAQGNTEKALSTLEELRRLNRKSVFAYEAAAQLMEETGDWEAAYEFRKDLEKVVGQDSSALADFQAVVGREMARRGDLREAKDHFKEAFRRDKHSLPAFLYAGDLKYDQGKVEDAIDLWKNVIEHHVERASSVYRRLEKAYFDLGQFETMMDIYEEVLARRPHDVPTLLAMAQFHRKKGDLEAAERTITRILEDNPEEDLAPLYLALIRAERGDDGGAAETLADLVERRMGEREKLRCSRCGYEANEVLWRCPRCGGWRTFLGEDLSEPRAVDDEFSGNAGR